VIVAAVGFLFLRMPTSYVPEEDQGVLMAQVMLPTGSTLESEIFNHYQYYAPKAVFL
jgi:multidrug efflux pump subunit AcrB